MRGKPMAKRTKRMLARATVVRDAMMVGVSVAIAIALSNSRWFKHFTPASGVSAALACFVAGLLYSSVFTVAPATVGLAHLAQSVPVAVVALLGGLGAMLGDALVFRFFRGALGEWIAGHRRRRWLKFRQQLQWPAVILGALVIASPLPDELGLALMGATRLPQGWFFPLALTFNTAGILVIALVGKYGA